MSILMQVRGDGGGDSGVVVVLIVCGGGSELYTCRPLSVNPRTPDVALPIQMLRYRDTFVTSIVTFCAIGNQI